MTTTIWGSGFSQLKEYAKILNFRNNTFFKSPTNDTVSYSSFKQIFFNRINHTLAMRACHFQPFNISSYQRGLAMRTKILPQF